MLGGPRGVPKSLSLPSFMIPVNIMQPMRLFATWSISDALTLHLHQHVAVDIKESCSQNLLTGVESIINVEVRIVLSPGSNIHVEII